MLSFTILAFIRYQKSVRIDWQKKCQEINGWERIYHLVVIPTLKDEVEIIRTTFNFLVQNNFPSDKFIVVLAFEEKDKERALKNAEIIKNEFGHKFFRFITTLHPKDLPGELAGKGSNIAYAGKQAKKQIDELKIPYENIIVSSFDVDTCVHPQYFSYLTYKYLTHPNPTRSSYQPIPLFNNNIWDAPALMRVVAASTTFWLLSETIRPDRLFTFASHSMSFKALVEVGFWQNDIVTEDSRIFIQGMIRYDGDYEVTPMYIPISMDTVLGKTFWQSMKNQYKQQRRWAYGIENFPFMAWNFYGNKKIPLGKKFKYIWNQLEGVYSWATAPILIFILGRLPLWVANWDSSTIKSLAITQNVPHVIQGLMIAAMVGLVLSAVLSTILLPPKPKRHKKWKFMIMVVQWIIFPVCMIVFGSIPATDAQTRLMLGRYLGFNVTEKIRK